MTFFHTKSTSSLPRHSWIFNQKVYHEHNAIGDIICCGLKDTFGNTTIALCINFDNKHAISLPKCPSAGIEFFSEISERDADYFIEKILDHFPNRSIQIRQSPEFYQTYQVPEIESILQTRGFDKTEEINHHVDLKDSNLFRRIHKMQIRKIEKCQDVGFTFQNGATMPHLEIYQFIKKCRNQQGLEPNISEEHFIRLLSQLPEHYGIFNVLSPAGELAACTITLKVNDTIVYNFLPAFDRKFKEYSPIALLNYEMYGDLKSQGFKYLDLGISSINGEPQKGLVDFKERMGGINSNRCTYNFEPKSYENT